MGIVEGKVDRRPWWKRQLTWGVAISLMLGVLSIVVDRGGDGLRLAALVALVGVAVTVGIELRFRMEEVASIQVVNADRQDARAAALTHNQEELHRQLQYFGAYAHAPQSYRDFMAEIVDDWQRVDQRGSVILGWARADAVRDFRIRLSELALGRAPVDIHSRHNFRSHPLQDFKQIRSLNITATNYWSKAHGRRFLDHQKTGIDSGRLSVSRIFVIGKDEIQNVFDVVQKNVAAGVQVKIVLRDEISSDPQIPTLKDLSLIIDHTGAAGVFTPSAPGEPEIFTNNPGEVRSAEDILEILEPYTHDVDELFPDVSRD